MDCEQQGTAHAAARATGTMRMRACARGTIAMTGMFEPTPKVVLRGRMDEGVPQPVARVSANSLRRANNAFSGWPSRQRRPSVADALFIVAGFLNYSSEKATRQYGFNEQKSLMK